MFNYRILNSQPTNRLLSPRMRIRNSELSIGQISREPDLTNVCRAKLLIVSASIRDSTLLDKLALPFPNSTIL